MVTASTATARIRRRGPGGAKAHGARVQATSARRLGRSGAGVRGGDSCHARASSQIRLVRRTGDDGRLMPRAPTQAEGE
ncbi:hypothetical protein BS78_05G223000 [Paspalum vaginatum]|nr:hypothetical protein BS78_05G223000 [Paspalum vaginatum]